MFDVVMSDIFYVICGKRITEEGVYNNIGKMPCITSKTTDDGITWYADEKWLYNFSKGSQNAIIKTECVTWSKDGNAGSLFYRNYPFYANDHCGILISKSEFKDSGRIYE